MVGYGVDRHDGGRAPAPSTSSSRRRSTASLQEGTDANLLCFNQTSGKGKCNGDSGGPSFATIDGTLLEVGITSFGDQNCQQFGADTRVDAEKEFINGNTSRTSTARQTPTAQMGHSASRTSAS